MPPFKLIASLFAQVHAFNEEGSSEQEEVMKSAEQLQTQMLSVGKENAGN